MKTSVRLLLEDFLGLMKEEGELDVFLPMLLAAMGHVLVHGAQKGPRQYGVDLASVGVDPADNKKKLFLWVVKRGDQGRSEWNSEDQSLRQSIDEAADVYLKTHVPPQFRKLKAKVCLATNGMFLPTITETLATYLKTYQSRHRVEAELVNGPRIAEWSEKYLLDEYILPSNRRALFRRMLANVAHPEQCLSDGMRLVTELVEGGMSAAKTERRRTKQLLMALRGVRTALTVLHVWASDEENLLASYRLSEFAVLRVWSALHAEVLPGNPFSQEFGALVIHHFNVGTSYHMKMDRYYRTQDALAFVYGDAVLVNRRVFEEIGRLSLFGCFCAWFGAGKDVEHMRANAVRYAISVATLLESHSCSGLPAFDGQSNAVHLGLLLLSVTGRRDIARRWLDELVGRLSIAREVRQYWPSSSSLEELMLLREKPETFQRHLVATSTFVPILLTWLSVYGMAREYQFVRDEVLPFMQEQGTTPNFWSPGTGFDAAVGDGRKLSENGVGESLISVPADVEGFLAQFGRPLAGSSPISEHHWFQESFPIIPMLASVFWGLQLPREMIVLQAMAFASDDGPEIAGP